jgi:L-asparagine transporter-like permease
LEEPAASHRIVRFLLIGYLAFLVYASLYPISSFRPPEKNPFALLFGKITISRTDALTNLPCTFPWDGSSPSGCPGWGRFARRSSDAP